MRMTAAGDSRELDASKSAWKPAPRGSFDRSQRSSIRRSRDDCEARSRHHAEQNRRRNILALIRQRSTALPTHCASPNAPKRGGLSTRQIRAFRVDQRGARVAGGVAGRVQVFEAPNLSAAADRAVSLSQSEYLCFAQDGDKLAPTFLRFYRDSWTIIRTPRWLRHGRTTVPWAASKRTGSTWSASFPAHPGLSLSGRSSPKGNSMPGFCRKQVRHGICVSRCWSRVIEARSSRVSGSGEQVTPRPPFGYAWSC